MNKVVRYRLAFMLLMFLVFSLGNATAKAAPGHFEFMTNASSGLEGIFGDYDFDLYNRTNGWVLNGFYTYEDGKWSRNWLKTKLQPGKYFHMVWSAASNKGDCVVPFKTTWDDYDKAESYKVDWCKGIKAIYLKDDGITADYK